MQFVCSRCASRLLSARPPKHSTAALTPQRWTSRFPPPSRITHAGHAQSRQYGQTARTLTDRDFALAKALRSGEFRLVKTIQQDHVKARRYDIQKRSLSSKVGGRSQPEHRNDLDRSQTRERSRPFWKRRATIIGLLIAGALVWKATQMLLRDEDKELAADRRMFKGYTLVERERVSSTASIFHLRPTFKSMDEGTFQDWLRRGIMNLELKQPQIQVVRAYTPLPNMGPESTLRFLIRHEPTGEVSSWLHRLPINSQLEMRGPNYEFSIPSETRSIIFLAGGTGIAPALQAAHGLLEQPSPNGDGTSPGNGKTIHILWASRRREDCAGGVSDLKQPALFSRLASAPPTAVQAPSLFSRLWKAVTFQTGDATPLASSPERSNGVSGSPGGQFQQGLIVRELEALKSKYPGQISVSYFVDEESTFITEDSVRQTLKAISASTSSASSAPAVRTASTPATQILVSGPDGFINALAGPKIWAEGRQIQGPVQGMLRKVLLDEQSAGKQGADVGVYKI